MSLRRRGGGNEALNPWPGYVDALSTLLMVIIFVLLVFVLAQAFLGLALTGKDQALDRLNRQMSQLSDLLALERNTTSQLQGNVAGLNASLANATGQAAALRTELDRTTAADRAVIAARTAELAQLTAQVAALSTLRDDLDSRARTATARAETEAQARAAVAAQLDDERILADSARAQIALMSQQLTALRAQMTQLAAALDLSGRAAADKDTQIANLGAKLNAALASKVEELQRYRSEFFGRLRTVLANRPGVQVVGDRFVFQSEVLFPVGSADMTAAGQDQIRALAGTLKSLAAEIPPDLAWIMRVDGHADPTPVSRGAFASNWELSAQRAITVVKLLVAEGVPANHLAATGFGEYQPIAPGDTPDAYAKDRRIELRLTDR